jgi:organic radical activating enzyme
VLVILTPNSVGGEGIVGVSLVDGVVRSTGPLEINVTTHCNLRCHACSHLSPVAGVWQVEPDVLKADLIALSKAYRPSYVRLLGGEPLLHDRLSEVLEAVKASGISPVTQICSNGLLISRVDEAVWSYVDELELSIYPVRGYDRDWLSMLQEIAGRGVNLKLELISNFRESFAAEKNPDVDLVRRIYRTCMIAHTWLCHTLHNGVFYKCPQAAFVSELKSMPPETDGVKVHAEAGSLASQLYSYLTTSEYLETCAYCLGSAGALSPHHQVPRVMWLPHPSLGPAELVDYDFLAELEASGPLPDGCSQGISFDELAELACGRSA